MEHCFFFFLKMEDFIYLNPFHGCNGEELVGLDVFSLQVMKGFTFNCLFEMKVVIIQMLKISSAIQSLQYNNIKEMYDLSTSPKMQGVPPCKNNKCLKEENNKNTKHN